MRRQELSQTRLAQQLFRRHSVEVPSRCRASGPRWGYRAVAAGSRSGHRAAPITPTAGITRRAARAKSTRSSASSSCSGPVGSIGARPVPGDAPARRDGGDRRRTTQFHRQRRLAGAARRSRASLPSAGRGSSIGRAPRTAVTGLRQAAPRRRRPAVRALLLRLLARRAAGAP